MITTEKAEECLHNLAQTDNKIGHLRAQVEARDYKRKLVRADGILQARQNEALKTADEREAWAMMQEAYKEACREHVKAIAEYEGWRARRATWQLTWETWRSQESSRRQGGVI